MLSARNTQVLIDRMYEVDVAHPSYYTSYAIYLRQEVMIDIQQALLVRRKSASGHRLFLP